MGQHVVTLVNPNKIHPPITPYALDILTTSLEQYGFEVDVVDLTLRRDEWPVVLRDYFTGHRPLLVGVTVRNTDTIYPQEQKVFLGEHREVITEIRRLTDAPIIAGGVGFSSMPFALVDYFGIDYGVKGPGEEIICRLAHALVTGASPRTVPGLIINEGGGKVTRVPTGHDGVPGLSLLSLAGYGEDRAWQVNRDTPYTRRSGAPYKVDNLAYYQRGGLGNILTKNGCPFTCSHCVEPDAKGNRFARRTVEAVVDEMEALTAQGVYDLHTTDSEFNLAIANSKAILREIIRRKNTDASSPLHQLRLWIYSQPAPFDEEFAELLAEAGCRGVNVAPDHVRDDLLDGWKVTEKDTRYYTFDDTVRVVELTRKYGMLCMVEVLLGMPGETLDTLRECIDKTLALNATVVGYTLGLRVFPYSPLGMRLAAECDGVRTVPGLQSNTATEPIVLKPAHQCASVVEYERQFMWEPSGGFRPLYYFSPDLPEDPETIARPNGRWLNTLQFLWDYIPQSEYPRVMLPTAPGLTRHDNNYADNPFLTSLVQLGYKGAFWARWRDRDRIIEEARARGIAVPAGA
ncbi:tryptophan 2-C-methyltransferase [Carbonactinospora thermoautotrophica]|uniref:tryptophan 2-C-methyltransferase n=1 Tax=Carbonactinospora thermoautotrophica TaxID=1469144 RepID=UPI002271B155|nr:tryptophan 2-C-methyltransferase [Carbonactinospora thermoautotrophica]MCX9193782.1 tryptophan 2-C-methyltransferase [Carbonactinospora thermoautotrophica]